MKSFLEKVRKPEKKPSVKYQIIVTLGIILFGFALGVLQKWFWNVRDFIIICGGIILSVVVLVNLWNVLPFAATACFAFLSLRVDETAIMDYIFNAVKFFLTSQQLYLWRKN